MNFFPFPGISTTIHLAILGARRLGRFMHLAFREVRSKTISYVIIVAVALIVLGNAAMVIKISLSSDFATPKVFGRFVRNELPVIVQRFHDIDWPSFRLAPPPSTVSTTASADTVPGHGPSLIDAAASLIQTMEQAFHTLLQPPPDDMAATTAGTPPVRE